MTEPTTSPNEYVRSFFAERGMPIEKMRDLLYECAQNIKTEFPRDRSTIDWEAIDAVDSLFTAVDALSEFVEEANDD